MLIICWYCKTTVLLIDSNFVFIIFQELRRRWAEIADSESHVTELNIELSQQINQLINDRTAKLVEAFTLSVSSLKYIVELYFRVILFKIYYFFNGLCVVCLSLQIYVHCLSCDSYVYCLSLAILFPGRMVRTDPYCVDLL